MKVRFLIPLKVPPHSEFVPFESTEQVISPGVDAEPVRREVISEPTSQRPQLRPNRVVTDSSKKDAYDEQLRTAMRYMKSGETMPT